MNLVRRTVFGNFTPRIVLLRLLAVAVGATIGAFLGGGTADAHVYGAGKFNTQLNVALREAEVPHVGHVRVLLDPPKGCEGALGCTDSRWQRTIYVNPNQSPLQFHVSFWHEMGHRWDFAQMDPNERREWLVLHGWDRGMFWWNIFGDGSDTPGEVFAESYAWCALGLRPTHKTPAAYGYRPTTPLHADTCALILRTDDPPPSG